MIIIIIIIIINPGDLFLLQGNTSNAVWNYQKWQGLLGWDYWDGMGEPGWPCSEGMLGGGRKNGAVLHLQHF